MNDNGFVDFPWARAHILQVIKVPLPYQDVALELLQFENGQYSLRFAAYSKGQLVNGPLVIHEEDLPAIAKAASASPEIQDFLARLAAGKNAT